MRVLTLVIVCVFLTMYNCYYLTQQTVLLRFLFVPDHQMIQIEHNSVIPVRIYAVMTGSLKIITRLQLQV